MSWVPLLTPIRFELELERPILATQHIVGRGVLLVDSHAPYPEEAGYQHAKKLLRPSA